VWIHRDSGHMVVGLSAPYGELGHMVMEVGVE
jgi:hypothetical protein